MGAVLLSDRIRQNDYMSLLRVKGSAGRLNAAAAQFEAVGIISENSCLWKWSCWFWRALGFN
jgi:hypothetical protein